MQKACSFSRLAALAVTSSKIQNRFRCALEEQEIYSYVPRGNSLKYTKFYEYKFSKNLEKFISLSIRHNSPWNADYELAIFANSINLQGK